MNKLPIVSALAVAFAAPAAFADGGDRIHIALTGYNEVPSVSTPARGEFKARISKDEKSIDYELSYQRLQGTVTQSHIHFSQRHVNGAIVVWLCQTATNAAPVGTPPTCPASTDEGVTVTGTIHAGDVLATAAAQQLPAGALDEVIAAIRAGSAYVNVHSSVTPTGEIRGQLGGERGPSHHGHRGGRD